MTLYALFSKRQPANGTPENGFCRPPHSMGVSAPFDTHVLPQVAVDSRNPFSRYLFCCLGLYMIGLGDQGCNSVALEVCKLLLAMDLSYDAFHALLHIDFYALRAKCYEFLDTFSREYVRQHFDYVADLDSLSVGGGTGTPTSESSQNQNNLALLKELKISLSVVTPVWDLRMSIPSFAFSSALASFFAVPGGSIKACRCLSCYISTA